MKAMTDRAAERRADTGAKPKGSENSDAALFKQLDSDGSGTLTRDEIVKNCHLLKITTEEAIQRSVCRVRSYGPGSVRAP